MPAIGTICAAWPVAGQERGRASFTELGVRSVAGSWPLDVAVAACLPSRAADKANACRPACAPRVPRAALWYALLHTDTLGPRRVVPCGATTHRQPGQHE